MRDNDFAVEICAREASKALRMLHQMRQWLVERRAQLTSTEIEYAEERSVFIENLLQENAIDRFLKFRRISQNNVMTKSLDLGCGSQPKNPFKATSLYGIDLRENVANNIFSADLAVDSIPFQDSFFEYITAFHFIEHVPPVIYSPKRRNAFIELMNEIYRVLKPGGLFLSLTPAFPHAVTFRDPTHVNFITDETFPLYFNNINRWASIYGYTGAFKIEAHEWRGPCIFAVMRKVAVPLK